MTGPDWARFVALAVGTIQIVANGITLARGIPRISWELSHGALPERFADLLMVAWIYGGLANLCISGMLVILANPLREGNPAAWRAGMVIGVYYVLVGIGMVALGVRRHPALLLFVAFGVALLIPLWASRQAFGLR